MPGCARLPAWDRPAGAGRRTQRARQHTNMAQQHHADTTDEPTTDYVTEDDLDRDDAGIVNTQSGAWHVFRHGDPFSCAKGDADLLGSGGPYADAEIVADESSWDATAREIREALEAKRDDGERVCLKCASSYSVDYPKSSSGEAGR